MKTNSVFKFSEFKFSELECFGSISHLLISCRHIAEEFKIEKTQTANVVKNEAKLREELANFQGKGFKHIKRETFFILGLKMWGN